MRVDKDVEKYRWNKCNACPFKQNRLVIPFTEIVVPFINLGTPQCGKCSCFLDIKILIKDSTCPIKKW